MAPKKATHRKNRDATVVYPGTSPELMVAYRIFGPGHEDLEALLEVKNSIIKPVTPPEGVSQLTPLGLDIANSLKVGLHQIIAAYETYKKEIERMNEADRNHKKRKHDQLDGVDTEDGDNEGDNNDENDGDNDSDNDGDSSEEVASGSSSSSSGGNEEVVSSIEEGEGEEEQQQEGGEQPGTYGVNGNYGVNAGLTEEWCERFLAPGLWLSHEEALARIGAIRAAFARMHTPMGTCFDQYCVEFPPTKELEQAMTKAMHNYVHMRQFAFDIECMIEKHDGSAPHLMWTGPEERNVTYGFKVTETLCAFWEMQYVIDDMEASLGDCDRVRQRYIDATTLADRKHLFDEYVFNLRRFASMCLADVTREEFLEELEDERNRWSPESSPLPVEYGREFAEDKEDLEYLDTLMADNVAAEEAFRRELEAQVRAARAARANRGAHTG